MRKPPVRLPCTRSENCGRESAFLVITPGAKTSDARSCITHLGKIIDALPFDEFRVVRIKQ